MGQLLATLLLVAYFFARFVFEGEISGRLGSYASYGVDLVFAIVALIGFWSRWKFLGKIDRRGWVQIFIALGAGALIYSGISPLGLKLPFDLHDPETIVLLIFLGPILEELVFRGGVYLVLEKVLKSTAAAVLVSAIVFSYAHFEAYSRVPVELRSFVMYQAVYTLILGVWFAGAFISSRRLLHPILLHIGFNFGFWVAGRLLG